MNRIDAKFAELKAKNRKAFIPFITAGDGGIETTERLVLELERAGADLIELGVPFSDPIAEGPVIQNASARALKSGTKLSDIFALVRRLREKTQVPLLLMLYLNSIFGSGMQGFFTLCAQSGVDGVIVPDMPYEEKDEIKEAAARNGVLSISLVTPVSHGRIQKIAREAEGFLYCVSSVGVTGVRSAFSTDFDAFFQEIRQYASVPCAVGFGISTPEQAARMKRYCDGVIVGSAIVSLVERYGADSPGPVAELASSLRRALDEDPSL